MKRILIGLICGLLCWGLGYYSHKPKIITNEIRTEVRIYDLSQEPKAMEIYANMMGKTLESKKDVDEYKHNLWSAGYQEGYRAGFFKSNN